MCGLVGLWGAQDEKLVISMLDKLGHRGPNGQGTCITSSASAVLGHQRLSIIDIDGGKQPIGIESEVGVLVHNGEIYNDLSIRESLANSFNFSSQSDSESILHGISAWGMDAGPKFDGMFAFLRVQDGELFAGRDPLGIKPLYIGHLDDGSLLFASEIKALAGLTNRIEEFPPGTLYSSISGYKKYYSIPSEINHAWNSDKACESLRLTMTKAVNKRLRSDVPVGAFLSGGVDSSIIVAIAKRTVKNLHTFAAGTKDSPDLIAARSVADYLGTIHHEYVVTEEDIDQHLDKIIYHLESYDLSLVPNAVPCYFASLEASKHVKVVLTGEGADELFAGYGYHLNYNNDEDLHAELRRSLATMHNINLQRVDRMTMAVGIEGRVPFLDTEVIELGLSIPRNLKIKKDSGSITQKWILRKAFEDYLPNDVVWRTKSQFAHGSGVSDLLSRMFNNSDVKHDEFNGPESSFLEQEHYLNVFKKCFANIDNPTDLVNCWESNRVSSEEIVQ